MSYSKPQVRRTYGSQNSRPRFTATQSQSDTSLSGSPIQDTGATQKRKRPLTELFPNGPPPKKLTSTKHSSTQRVTKAKKMAELTQLHFCIDQSILRTCPLCGLTYTKGAIEDESLHKTHCIQVQRGLEWGREEDREARKDGGACVVEEDVVVGHGERGRIIAIKPSSGGRLGTKALGYLKTVNLALSAPDIPTSALESCKAYLFLLRYPGCAKEKIVGCVVAQRISSAMEIVSEEEVSTMEHATASLVHVEGNLYCKPECLPTPMGVPRLFVSSAHRRKGIARALLSAAARTFIHGCELNPAMGEVAFSQPTSMGRAVMERWGNGGVRVYKE